MFVIKSLFIFLSILPLARSEATAVDSGVLPRPMILQIDGRHSEESNVDQRCTSWRVAEEANNLAPWKRIPEECAGYVRKYMTGRGYQLDLQTVSIQAGVYARGLNLSSEFKYAWVFDVDETLLSNLPYYADHAYGLELFDNAKFDAWTELGEAPAIESSMKLYNEVLSLGIEIVLLTGRSERHRNITVHNLSQAGFRNWHKLLMRSPEDAGKTAVRFKSEKRKGLTEEGYRILGNSGDQWSDLLDSYMGQRSFKLPNPMYFIS